MTRKKIEIKKIDNLAARQVAFSKRRKGLFKKARELATLCDADIALIVFSASGKLFDYSTSSVQKVVERFKHYMQGQQNHEEPIKYQLENSDEYTKMEEEFAKKTLELRQMRGEQLEGLSLEELNRLEAMVEKGLSHVSVNKDDQLLREINARKTKALPLMEENQRLKDEVSSGQCQLRGAVDRSPEMELVISSYSAANSSVDHHSSADISLKLGLCYP